MVNSITDHIDIWTAAQIRNANGGRGRGKNSNGKNSHGIQKLRELILELAVRGKLVHQDPNDEPANVLIKNIAKEKKRLIKEKKIRNAKLAPENEMPEVNIELPSGWVVAKIADLLVNSSDDIVDGPFGSKLKASEYTETGTPIIRIQNVDRNLFKEQGIQFISIDKARELERHNFIAGDIVLNKLGEPAGKACIVPEQLYRGIIVADIIRIRLDEALHDKQFIIHSLNSPLVALQFAGLAKGMTRQRVNLSQTRAIKIPIPPLAEQHRIVAKVDELMALCNRLEQQQADSNETHQILVETLLATLTNVTNQDEFSKAWQQIAHHFDILFTTEQSVDELIQTILQFAVMGKLVPQDPSDEPASVLLEKIAKENSRLIKEGKIKKQKKLPELGEDEKLINIPTGWEWVSLGTIVKVMDAGWSPACPPESSPSDDVWGVLKTTAVQVMQYLEQENKMLPANIEPKPQYEVNVGDILITRAGPKNRVAISCLVEKTRPKLMISDKTIRFHLISVGISERYISLCLNAGETAKYLESAKSGMAESQMNISQFKLRIAPIPLCPVNEQHRIVAKVDELMILCDDLKARLIDVQNTKVQLADAIVEQPIV